jgi:S-adenosyl methyltransferase
MQKRRILYCRNSSRNSRFPGGARASAVGHLVRPPRAERSPATDGSPELDTTVPHSARVWNYWLGGTDNYPADQLVGDQVMAMFPDIIRLARADRAFLARAVRYLVAGAGIRQFLDIGTGLPTAGNTHQVAQTIAADSRVVYVDNDRCKSGCAHALVPLDCLKRTWERMRTKHP